MNIKVRLVQGPEGAPSFCFGLYVVNGRPPGHKRRDDESGYKRGECVLFVQSDWDYASLACSLGWSPCECGRSDGTVNCEHWTASEMLADAFDFLSEYDGECFEYEVSPEYA